MLNPPSIAELAEAAILPPYDKLPPPPAIIEKSPLAVLLSPPPIVEPIPVTLLLLPPPIEPHRAFGPTKFEAPPTIAELAPAATLPSVVAVPPPAPTNEKNPFAVLYCPATIAEPTSTA